MEGRSEQKLPLAAALQERQRRAESRLHGVCSAANMVVINGEGSWGVMGGWGACYFPPMSVCQYVKPYVCVQEGVYTKETAEGVGYGAAQVPLTIPTCWGGCALSFSWIRVILIPFLPFPGHLSDIFHIEPSVISNPSHASPSAARRWKRGSVIASPRLETLL